MNRIHDHPRVTPSNEADRLEGEIEQIQDTLGGLLSEFTARTRHIITPGFLLDKRVLRILGCLYAYCFLKSFFRKKRKPIRCRRCGNRCS